MASHAGGHDMTGSEINGIIAAILLALGVAAPVPAFTGGMLLALGAAYAVRSFRGAETQKGILLSLFAGAFFAILAAGMTEATAGVWLWGSIGGRKRTRLNSSH